MSEGVAIEKKLLWTEEAYMESSGLPLPLIAFDCWNWIKPFFTIKKPTFKSTLSDLPDLI